MVHGHSLLLLGGLCRPSLYAPCQNRLHAECRGVLWGFIARSVRAWPAHLCSRRSQLPIWLREVQTAARREFHPARDPPLPLCLSDQGTEPVAHMST